MRWLIIFVLSFVLSFATGCATTSDPLGIIKGLENELQMEAPQDQRKVGWVPMSDSGYSWHYWAGDRVLASCSYQYMKISDVEQWRGSYYGSKTDFMMKTERVQASNLKGLSGCVVWVEHHMYGGAII